MPAQNDLHKQLIEVLASLQDTGQLSTQEIPRTTEDALRFLIGHLKQIAQDRRLILVPTIDVIDLLSPDSDPDRENDKPHPSLGLTDLSDLLDKVDTDTLVKRILDELEKTS